MHFRECINCAYLSCTLNKLCILSPEDPGPNWLPDPVPTLEALAAAQANPLHDFMDDDYQRPTSPDDMRDAPPAAEPPCNVEFSHNGLCPCCGVEVERSFAPGSQGGLHDECMSCGWESSIFYDW